MAMDHEHLVRRAIEGDKLAFMDLLTRETNEIVRPVERS
jgi:hypothetical protein